MNLSAKLLGKVVGVGILGILVLTGGLFAVGVLGVPDGGLEDNQWGEVDNDSIEVLTTVYVDNPNPFGIGGDADVEYEIDLQGVRMAEGEGEGISVSSGYNTLEFETDLLYERLPEWWYRHLSNDEVSSLEVDATVHTSVGPFSGSPSGSHEDEIETDIEEALDDGFSEFEGSYSGTDSDVRLPDGTAIEPTVDIEEVEARWGEVTESETEVMVTAHIHNPNAYPIPTPAFAGAVEMNDITISEWSAGEVRLLDSDGDRLELGEDDAMIPGGETRERTFVIGMDNQRVAEWFATHVDSEAPAATPGEEFTRMVISGQLAMEVGGSEITIPQQDDAIACEFDLTTAIFVDQEEEMALQTCGVSPLELAEGELEAAGAILDPSETDEWEDIDGLLGDSDNGVLNDDDDDDGLLDSE